jgi:cytidylate kinase
VPGGPKLCEDVDEEDRCSCNQVLVAEGRDEGGVVVVEAIHFVQLSVSMLSRYKSRTKGWLLTGE